MTTNCSWSSYLREEPFYILPFAPPLPKVIELELYAHRRLNRPTRGKMPTKWEYGLELGNNFQVGSLFATLKYNLSLEEQNEDIR